MMEQLYNLLTTKLLAINPNVGFKRVKSDTPYPYVTYRFVNSTQLNEGDKEDIIIEVDIWHQYSGGVDSVTQIESITKQIENALKRERHLNGSTFFLFQLINKLEVDDEDETILRKQLRFRVRSYE